MEWWQSYPWHWWADLFFGKQADPVYDQTKLQVDFLEKAIPLKRGYRVLDLSTGNGRHAIELAKRGYVVTGFDYSKQMLIRARRKAKEAGINIPFKQGDMRKLTFSEEFDLIINLFQSFGYFKTENQDKEVLKRIFLALKPHGKLLLDLRNPGFVFSEIKKGRNAALKPEYTFPGGFLKTKEYFIKPNIWRVNFYWQRNGRKFNDKWQAIRLYTLKGLTAMLKSVGFQVKKAWGDYTGEGYHPNKSKRLIILAQK